jgi:ferric-dicitrate binding protein FerR (iron transport regulator)
MATISDHHQYLFLGKITNTLTAEEDRELQELFARDDQAQGAYEELLRQLPPEQVAGSFSHLNQPGFWKNLPGEIRDQQVLTQQRQVLRTAVVLGLIGCFAVSGWWFLAGKRTEKSSPPIAGAPARSIPGAPARSVELRLADGSTVDLTATSGKLQKGQLVLDNSNGSLRYHAVGPLSQAPGASTVPGARTATGTSSAIGLNTVDVPIAMDYKITLSDSSEIWLNSVSSISFPSTFAADKREITIRGEAYCRIAKHANQPFIIHLPGNTVRVTGTEFNVNTYSASGVRVALVNGGVNLVAGATTVSGVTTASGATTPSGATTVSGTTSLSAATSVKINPGFQAISTNGKIEQAPFQADKVLGWRQGIYSFDGADLDEISQVLARWFGTRTQLDDPSLAHKKFAGALYKQRPLSSFLDNFKVISHIDSYFDAKGALHFTAVK